MAGSWHRCRWGQRGVVGETAGVLGGVMRMLHLHCRGTSAAAAASCTVGIGPNGLLLPAQPSITLTSSACAQPQLPPAATCRCLTSAPSPPFGPALQVPDPDSRLLAELMEMGFPGPLCRNALRMG